MAFSKTIYAIATFVLFRPATASLYSYQSPIMASPAPSNLNVHIEPASEPAVLKVTISNTHENTPLTILTWDAPFERSARDSGVYHIQPTAPGGAELESLGIKIKRRLPAPRTALLEILPQSDVTKELELRSSWIPTDGQRYKVWARGPWRAVWAKSIQEITDDDLENIVGDFGEDMFFETNIVEVILTGKHGQ